MASKEEQVREYLRTIEKTRLLFNSLEELQGFVGYTKSNSLEDKGGNLFAKEAILHKLVNYAHDESYNELNLLTVIDAYREATLMLEDKNIIKKMHQDDVACRNLINFFYAQEPATKDIKNIVKIAKQKHVPLLVLMMLSALPHYGHARGDLKDIGKHYKQVYELLDKVFKNRLPTQQMPLFAEIKNDFENDIINSPASLTRWRLIYETSGLLEEFGRASTPENLKKTINEAYNMMVFPEIEGCWCDVDDEDSYWCFEHIINGFQLIHACLDNYIKQIKYTKYYIQFFSSCEDETIMAVVEHPHSIRYEIQRKPVPEEYYAYFEFTRKEDSLIFDSWFPSEQWMPLKKLTPRNFDQDQLESLINSGYQVIYESEEDDYEIDTSTIAAITKEYIYFSAGRQQYYKIPKSRNKVLHDININSYAGIMHFDGKTYIAFSDCQLYYDVSTEEQMASAGIELVDSITD